jgi:hypothetical protein
VEAAAVNLVMVELVVLVAEALAVVIVWQQIP